MDKDCIMNFVGYVSHDFEEEIQFEQLVTNIPVFASVCRYFVKLADYQHTFGCLG